MLTNNAFIKSQDSSPSDSKISKPFPWPEGTPSRFFSRRSFLKALLATPIAATVDFEQLLWVPKPIITVPGNVMLASYSEIVAMELERIQPLIQTLFERDSLFYENLVRRK